MLAESTKLYEKVQTLKWDTDDCFDFSKKVLYDWFINVSHGTKLPLVKEQLHKGKGAWTASQFNALCLGSASHSVDFDDTLSSSAVHPGGPIFAALFSDYEDDVVHNGMDIIEATIKGYEVAARLGRTINPFPHKSHHNRGFHPTSTVGVFSGLIAKGTYTKASESVMKNAMGIGGSLASGIMAFLDDGSPIKRIHPGIAAVHALWAIQLAETGITGPAYVFESSHGMLHAMSDHIDENALTKEYDRPLIFETAQKYYPCCHHIHPALDAAKEFLEKEDVQNIAKIIVQNPTAANDMVGFPLEKKRLPKSPVEAQMSLPYTLAAFLLDGGKLSLSAYTERSMKDTLILDLANRIFVESDVDLDKRFNHTCWPVEVTFELNNNSVLTFTEEFPIGFPQKPLTWEHLDEKARIVEVYNELKEIQNLIRQLESLDQDGVKFIHEFAQGLIDQTQRII
ncbi:MmgE/PrpD family protein [Neobacillus sp. YX16]|uniref:MmgE/PrpD family protein n=1 Tax=Neobacillus sp. YX16 TaxID=3047874 RepID=UPI0024C259BD|nr:MmgE/PrpD family protein [Neobacillus sp. YX16]WHZ00878.1 MmgE/PrpD family protein [Neobacillus sp. YX16]